MITSLGQLQEHVAEACGFVGRGAGPHDRDVVDISVAVGTQWLKRHRPDHNARDEERFHIVNAKRARKKAAKVGLVAFLLLEVIGFLIQRALKQLWEWYWADQAHPATCAAIAPEG